MMNFRFSLFVFRFASAPLVMMLNPGPWDEHLDVSILHEDVGVKG
jgi:hypothetical protein